MSARPVILVIEDNPLNMELVVDLLTGAGFSVLTAANAEQGLALAQSEEPCLILMDISLPGTDGLQATRQLKTNSRTAQLRVIALTAHAMAGDEAKARAAGCDGYLTKPISTRDFIRQINHFLQERPTSTDNPIPSNTHAHQ